jgi:hypothetical protein
MQIYTRLCTCLSTHTTRLQLKRRFAIAISAIIVRIQALPVAANTPVVFNVRCRRAFAHASTKRRCVHNACACKRSYGQAKHFICISSHSPGKMPVCRSKHSPLLLQKTYRCSAQFFTGRLASCSGRSATSQSLSTSSAPGMQVLAASS